MLFPTAVWILIAYIHRSAMYYAGHGSIPFDISWTYPLIANGAAWFIFALFYAKLGMWCLSKLNLHRIVELIIVLIVGMFGCMCEMPLFIDEGLSAIPIYYAGKRLYPYLGKLIKNRYVLFFSFIAFCSVALSFYPYVLVPMRNEAILLYPLFLTIAIFSFIFFLYISSKLQYVKWLQKYGQHTFGILLTHCMFLHTFAVAFNRLLGKGTPIWIVAFALAYVFTCVVSFRISVWCEKYAPFMIGKMNKRR